MSLTYRALAVLLSYPTEQTRELVPAAAEALSGDSRIPRQIRAALATLTDHLSQTDLFDLQEQYVWLFDRTRSLSLNLYEHVHGESRDRGQAMVGLLELYRSKGLELSGDELPDHLPVFLEFLSTLPDEEAASLLGEGAHVLHALGERLHRRDSQYRAVFGALSALAGGEVDRQIVAALLAEPDDDPGDLAAMDRLWAESAVSFGPSEAGCSEREAMERPAPGAAGQRGGKAA